MVRAWIVIMIMVLAALPSAWLAGRAWSASAAPGTGDAFGLDLPQPDAPPEGVTWGRATADWAAIEPARGTFVWTELDAQVHAAGTAHLHLLVLLEHMPQWAALEPTAPQAVWLHQPPKEIADWALFVHAIVHRYLGRVSAWQVEPSLDLVDFRGTTADYREMLHVVRQESQHADSQALVVAASPGGLDLPYTKTMLTAAGGDFDAMMLYPHGRRPAELLEALGIMRTRLLSGGSHQLWLDGTGSVEPGQIAAAALAGGVVREFWPRLDPGVATAIRMLGGARFVGAVDRGPEIALFVFEKAAGSLAVAWAESGTHEVPIATTGAPALIGATGQPIAPSGAAGVVSLGAAPVFIHKPRPLARPRRGRRAAAGPPLIPIAPDRDFAKAPEVSAQLAAVNVEHGLYNQMFRTLPAGAVFPVTVDGIDAVRTNPSTNAVYLYFDVADTYAYFDDGRYDLLITVQVHRASAAQLVGFNLLYDSMTGYRFTPWQWVDAGAGWATYTARLTDAAFAHTWGWDFAINGAGDQKEPLVVRSVTP